MTRCVMICVTVLLCGGCNALESHKQVTVITTGDVHVQMNSSTPITDSQLRQHGEGELRVPMELLP